MFKLTTTPSTVTCLNANGYDVTCNYFATVSSNFCSNLNAFLNGAPFYVTCKKSCNLCNGGSGLITSSTTTTTPCQNAPGYNVSCNFFSKSPFTFCQNIFAYLGSMPFSVACKKSCNLC